MKNIKHLNTILVVLLSLNALFLIYVAFIKKDAIDMEVMKAGGRENYKMIEKLYQNPGYVSQQKQSIQQGLDAFGIK